jgi:outer membrane protein assembly factor BamD (BamD/ComL family)
MKKMLPILLVLIIIAASCDRRGPDQLLEDAEVNITQNKFDDAVKDLEKLVNKYPDHEKAVQTSYRIAELHMNKRQDLDAAIVSFKKAANTFPNSEVGPKACFMAGFLLANNTDRLDEAKTTYEKFLKSYPDHELKIAVEFELENLGKPLDNIPQLKPILEDDSNLRENRTLGK